VAALHGERIFRMEFTSGKNWIGVCPIQIGVLISSPHALVDIPPTHNSDHNPLLLCCLKARTTKNNRFHFQAAQVSHPDYGALVEATWKHTSGNIYH